MYMEDNQDGDAECCNIDIHNFDVVGDEDDDNINF